MLTFRTVDRYEPDDWTTDAPVFSIQKNLDLIEGLTLQGRVLIAEHWHYRGSRRQDRIIVEDFEHFVEHLNDNAVAGDAFDVYDITDLWSKKDSPIISGKCPDENGQVPKGGAY